jgi:hypothetical protein
MTCGSRPGKKKQKEQEKEGTGWLGLLLGWIGLVRSGGPKPFFFYSFSNLTENCLLFCL